MAVKIMWRSPCRVYDPRRDVGTLLQAALLHVSVSGERAAAV